MTPDERRAVEAMASALKIARSYMRHQVPQPRGPEERNVHAAAEVGLRLATMAGLLPPEE